MEHPLIVTVMAAALLVPVVLFWILRSRTRLGGLRAGAIAVAVGWALNVFWAWLVQRAAPADGAPLASAADSGLFDGQMQASDMLSIAAAFGWICPTVLVLLTALAWWLVKQRAR